MNKMFRKYIDIIFLLICLSFIFLGLFAHFVLQRLSFQNMILAVLFFGAGAIVQIISLTSKHKGWLLDKEYLTKNQTIIIGICSLVFSICSLWIALIGNVQFVFA